jgi:Hus1-like protein
MKFKCVLVSVQVSKFITWIKSLSDTGNSKNVILLLDKELCKAVTRSEDNLNSLLYSSLTTSIAFHEFLIESKNKNRIILEFSISNLLTALKAGNQASEVSIKLAKMNNHPFFSIESVSSDGSVVIVQNVPVKLVPTAESLLDANISSPKVKVVLTCFNNLNVVADRFKDICKKGMLTISIGVKSRQMKLECASDLYWFCTEFQNITCEKLATDDILNDDLVEHDQNIASIDVDSDFVFHVLPKDFHKSLKSISTLSIEEGNIVLFVCPNNALVLFATTVDNYSTSTYILSTYQEGILNSNA